jgi:putative Holliday junction resolvase
VGNRATGSTQPLDTLTIQNGIDWIRIAALVGEWAPDILVVGLPLHEDGGEHEISTEARRFARRLEGRFLRPAVLVDERLSSHEAQSRLRELPSQRRGRRARTASLDSVAACLILETWFSMLPMARR